MTIGVFDTNSAALQQRIASHDRFGSRDLNEWIFAELNVEPGMSVLDLGCGTGKQTLPLAELVGPRGSVVAVDVSGESLQALHTTAAARGIGERIATVECSLDALPAAISQERFDRVLGSFSLYYTGDAPGLFDRIHDALRPDGVLFFCGPAPDNNEELKSFHYGLRGQDPPPDGPAATFMSVTAPTLVRDRFSDVQLLTFENPLRFDSAEALYAYWTSYNLYDPDRDADFRLAADQHFSRHSYFSSTKRVIGVKATK